MAQIERRHLGDTDWKEGYHVVHGKGIFRKNASTRDVSKRVVLMEGQLERLGQQNSLQAVAALVCLNLKLLNCVT